MDKFKDLAPFLVVVALAAGGAAAAIIVPVSNSIQASNENNAREIREIVQKIQGDVSENRARLAVQDYMLRK